jgi:hypothetical protein
MGPIKCEKCGAIMFPFKAGSTVGMTCPKCGWGWATTQFEPIVEDRTVYVIKIDCHFKPTREQFKVLSFILNVNYLGVRKLLNEGNASFEGLALDIRDKLKMLKDTEINYSVSPNFPYEIHARNMDNELTYETAYQQFKAEFKDDTVFFNEKENETGVDDTDGTYIQFGMVVVPYLYHLTDIQDEEKIKKCFDFFDKMCVSSDKELSDVVQSSILGAVVSNKDYLSKLKKYFTEEMKTYIPYLQSYINFYF